MEAMAQVLLHFRWNWIVVLASGDDYGRERPPAQPAPGARDICIAFQETLPTPQPDQTMTPQDQGDLEAIVGKLQRRARAWWWCSRRAGLHNFFREVLRQNFTGAVWIASESWAIDPVLHNLTELRVRHLPGHHPPRRAIRASSGSASAPLPPQPAPPSTGTAGATTWLSRCDTCLNTTESFSSILPTLSGERVVYSVYSSVCAVSTRAAQFPGLQPRAAAARMWSPLAGEVQPTGYPGPQGAGAESVVALGDRRRSALSSGLAFPRCVPGK